MIPSSKSFTSRLVAPIAAICFIAMFFSWTALSDGLLLRGQKQKDYYNLLLDGFLKGQLSMDVEVPEKLLECPNPYDPELRPEGVGLHDATLYRGKYYLYFGPVPTIVFLLPFRLVTHVALPVGAAILFAAILGFAICVFLLEHLRQNRFSGVSTGFALLVYVSFGLCSGVPFLLRRHSLYDLPITSGWLFSVAALASLYAALVSSKNPLRWSGCAGLFLGLAVGSRLTCVATTPILLLLWFAKPSDQKRESKIDRLKPLLAAIVPLVCIAAMLGLYNFLRFGDLLETGQRYQLSGLYETRMQKFSLGNIPRHLGAYFLAEIETSRIFPFVHLKSVPLPWGGDFGFGILIGTPMIWFSVFALIGLFANRNIRFAQNNFRVLCILFTWAFAANCFLMSAYFFMAIRYICDFLPFLAFLGSVGTMFALHAIQTLRRPVRLLISTLVLATLIYSDFMNIGASIDVYRRLPEFNPELFNSLKIFSERFV